MGLQRYLLGTCHPVCPPPKTSLINDVYINIQIMNYFIIYYVSPASPALKSYFARITYTPP